MAWEIEYTDEFEEWWNTLNVREQEAVAVTVGLLEKLGPNLPRPPFRYSKGIKIPQHERIAYATRK